MKLGEFIKNFSHNNVIRLVYKTKGGHQLVLDDWNDVSMDWEINLQRGKFRHFINNEVLGLATISFPSGEGVYHASALNIVIEKLQNQPYLDEIFAINKSNCESVLSVWQSMTEQQLIERIEEMQGEQTYLQDSIGRAETELFYRKNPDCKRL